MIKELWPFVTNKGALWPLVGHLRKTVNKGKEKHSSSLSPGMNFDRSAVSLRLYMENLFALFDLILYIPSTIFQLNRDRSSWLEPLLS